MQPIFLNNISFRFSKQDWLFEHFNFELIPNKFTCLLGSSGVGKSTLLRLVAGLIKPDSGSITPSLQDQISYLAQENTLLPWLTILDNVLLGYRLRGKTTSFLTLVSRAKSLLARVGLQHAERLRPAQLSGGMKQRAMLVRTLLEDRPVVLMDEPFSSLDAITRLQLQTLTADMLINKTVLMVTHDPLEALRLGHVVYVLARFPAKVHAISVPTNPPLRDITDPDVLSLQAELLQRLANETEVI